MITLRAVVWVIETLLMMVGAVTVGTTLSATWIGTVIGYALAVIVLADAFRWRPR